MRKLILCILLVSSFLSCESQMLMSNHGMIQNAIYDTYLIIGDSKSANRVSVGGTGSETIPTLASGIGYQWQRAPKKVVAITDASSWLYPAAAGGGWGNKFCLDYYQLSGRHALMINSGVGSSCFASTTTTLSWYTNGLLYDSAKKRANDCLTYIGASKLNGVIIILGINASSGTADATSVPSLIDRINADFPSTQIYIDVPSQQSAGSINGLKALIKSLEVTYSNVHCTINEAVLFSNGWNGDALHWNATGNNHLGHMLARYMTSQISDLDARRVVTCNFPIDLTATEELAWKTFILNGKTNGWWPVASYQCYKASHLENKFGDINGLCAADPSSSTTSNTGYIETGGTSTTYINTGYNSNYVANTTLNDVIMGTTVLTATPSAGTSQTLFGAGSGPFILIRQTTASGTSFAVNCTTTTNYATDAVIQSNIDYAVRRTASNAIALLKNGTSVQTATTASISTPTFDYYIGTRGASGGHFAGEYLQVQVEDFYILNTADYSSFTIDRATLKSGL